MRIKAVLTFAVVLSSLVLFWYQQDDIVPTNTSIKAPIDTAGKAMSDSLAQSPPAQSQREAITQTPANTDLSDRGSSEATSYADPIARIKAIQEKTELHRALLQDHDQFTRYPGHNHLISSAAQDPTLKRYEIDERSTLSEDKRHALNIWSDQKYYLQGDTAHIFASLSDANGQKLATRFAGQLVYNETQSLTMLEFSDADNDGVYQSSFAFETDDKRFTPGVYKVLIANTETELADAVAFILSEPAVKLTGEYRDQLDKNGDLVIEMQVEVKETNRFYFQGSLYSSTNDAIGTTQYASQLQAGMHWIPLSFHGLLIRDRGEPGPYILKNVSLAKVAMPIQRAPLAMPNYSTEGYTLDQFNQLTYAQMAQAKQEQERDML